MPAVALLIATAWPSVKLRATAVLVAIVGVLLVAAPMIPKLTAKMKPEIAAPVKTMALILGALLVIGGIVAALSKRRDLAVIAMSLPLLAFPVVATPVLNAVAERRSTHGLVQELKPHLQPGTEIIGVEAFAGSLAFYLRRPIVLASDDATEFTSNYLLRRYDKFSGQTGPLRPLSWYRDDLDRCCARRVYIVRSQAKEYRAMLEARGMKPIAEDARHVAYGPWTGLQASGVRPQASGAPTGTKQRDPRFP
jgi:hypothetical protein